MVREFLRRLGTERCVATSAGAEWAFGGSSLGRGSLCLCFRGVCRLRLWFVSWVFILFVTQLFDGAAYSGSWSILNLKLECKYDFQNDVDEICFGLKHFKNGILFEFLS